MMNLARKRIILLGDIHANLPALEAVITHARSLGGSSIWNIGDFVGYGAFPDEVVKRLLEEGATSIIGNYDLKVLRFPRRQKKWRQSKHPQKWLAFQWAYQNLSETSRAILRSLPQETILEEEGRRILLTHGSPASNEEALTPETPDERLWELLDVAIEHHGAPLDAVICGHSHQAFTRQVEQAWFINTGSVGRPDDGDPRACYAILSIGPELFQVEHYRVAYDIARAVQAIHANGLPEAFAQMLIQGRDLESVLNHPGDAPAHNTETASAN
jgi:putative phosphoesterase